MWDRYQNRMIQMTMILMMTVTAIGCASVAQQVAKPVLELAEKDSVATLKWVANNKEYLESIGTYELAQACPNAVIQLNLAREALDAEGEGFEGLIYHATVAKYGSDRLEALAIAVVDACRTLIPWEKVIR